MKDFKNLYEITKTVRFELKSIHYRGENHEDNISFQKSKKWMDEKFFYKTNKTESKQKRNEILRKNLKELFLSFDSIYLNFKYLLKQLKEKNIPPFCVYVQAPLLENFDANLFHKQKKKARFNQTKPVPLAYLKINNDYNWFITGVRNKLGFIRRYKLLIENHQLWEQSNVEEMQNNVRWYADIESFVNRYNEFLEFLEKKYIQIPKDEEVQKYRKLNEPEKNILGKLRENTKNFFWVSKIKEQRESLKEIIETIKENKFIECGMIGLNEKSLNKNLEKRNKMEKWLKNLLEKEQPRILAKIRVLDSERKIVLDGDKSKNRKGLYQLLNKESEKWVQNRIDKCPEFAIHLLQTPKYNQDIQDLIEQKKGIQNGEINEKYEGELENIKEKIYQLKIKKRIIQERKRLFLDKGILSFKYKLKNNLSIEELAEKIAEVNNNQNTSEVGKLLNFQNVWEFKKSRSGQHNFLNINYLKVLRNSYELYIQNNYLIKQKRNLSQKYGNNKSLINSLQREVERQIKIEHWGIILRDKDFYYLAFVDRERRKDLFEKYFISSENSEYEYLKYERLTFKALEKLALIENATFTEFDELEDKKLAKELREVYESDYKEKQFNEYKLTREEKQYEWKNKIDKADFAKEKQEEIKDNVIGILTKVIDKLGYSFTPKSHYKTLNEFASNINIQCYKTSWKKIDWQKLLKGEKNGEIKLFKIHNKDFSRKKREYQRSDDISKYRKNNLFTEYWLDLFEKNNKNIRLLPEIDLFKRRKEFSEDTKENVITKERSGKKELLNAIKQNRFFENKFYASFRLQFYPEKISPTVKEFNEGLKEKTQNLKKYFLGLDRGENELLTYCLIDEEGKVVIDKDTQKPVIGDWNKDDNEFDYTKQLKNFKETRMKLSQKRYELRIYKENNSQENLNTSEEYLKIKSEIQKLKDKNNKDEILKSEYIKSGFCGHALEQINLIMQKYKNVYIVMEDLDIEQNKEDEGNTNKEQNLEKLLGATAYQAIEDAIVSKFKYYQTKDYYFHGSQIVPNVERIRDLREVENKEKLERNKYGRIKYLKSKNQIGNLLFVDEFLTSQMCPECGFCICSKRDKDNAEKFGEPVIREEIKKMSWDPIGFMVGKKFKIKQLKYIQDGQNSKNKTKDVLNNIKNATLVNSNILGLLIPRLKARSTLYKNIKKDPFFCPKCGKNTEEENFTEPLKSGDDIAAYNIAKRGLEFIQEKNKSS